MIKTRRDLQECKDLVRTVSSTRDSSLIVRYTMPLDLVKGIYTITLKDSPDGQITIEDETVNGRPYIAGESITLDLSVIDTRIKIHALAQKQIRSEEKKLVREEYRALSSYNSSL